VKIIRCQIIHSPSCIVHIVCQLISLKSKSCAVEKDFFGGYKNSAPFKTLYSQVRNLRGLRNLPPLVSSICRCHPFEFGRLIPVIQYLFACKGLKLFLSQDYTLLKNWMVFSYYSDMAWHLIFAYLCYGFCGLGSLDNVC